MRIPRTIDGRLLARSNTVTTREDFHDLLGALLEYLHHQLAADDSGDLGNFLGVLRSYVRDTNGEDRGEHPNLNLGEPTWRAFAAMLVAAAVTSVADGNAPAAAPRTARASAVDTPRWIDVPILEDSGAVTTCGDFYDFLGALIENLRHHPEEWDNHDLGNFLVGLRGYVRDTAGGSRHEDEPDLDLSRPSWRVFAAFLTAATCYE
jgi:hypothetical protein